MALILSRAMRLALWKIRLHSGDTACKRIDEVMKRDPNNGLLPPLSLLRREAHREIESLVVEYIDAHPDFVFPPNGQTHPAVLALTAAIQPWLEDRLGGGERFWERMFGAAQEWWVPASECSEYRYYAVRFNFQAAFRFGTPRMHALMREVAAWRKRSPIPGSRQASGQPLASPDDAKNRTE